MKFKTGDKVKVVSLNRTKNRFGINYVMKTYLNRVFTIVAIDGDRVYFEEVGFSWSKYDLVLVNNNNLEIE